MTSSARPGDTTKRRDTYTMRVRKRREARTFCGLTFPSFGAYRSGDEYLEKKERTRGVAYIRLLIRAGLNAWRSHAAKWMTSADDVAATRRSPSRGAEFRQRFHDRGGQTTYHLGERFCNAPCVPRNLVSIVSLTARDPTSSPHHTYTNTRRRGAEGALC